MVNDSFPFRIVLASNSPRRKELLAGLGIPFTVRVLPDIDEHYPSGLSSEETAVFIASNKAKAYRSSMAEDELIITADTIVVCEQNILGKPHDEADAHRMLSLLSGQSHDVITGVCLCSKTHEEHFAVTTKVTFKQLSDEEITYYINNYHPLDKAGAYGIQEWIGYIGVTALEGSYFNVMGLPVQRVYEALRKWE